MIGFACMATPLRIRYERPRYHVPNRGDHREDMVRDGRHRFFQRSLFFAGLPLVLSGALFLVSCNPPPAVPVPPPLGPDSVTFLGTTKNQNIFDPWYVPPCREEAKPVLMPESKAYDSVNDPALRVFGLIVDSRDHRYTGTPAALTAYRDAKVADYGTKTNQYWRETSYKNVSVTWTMPDAVVQLPGTYNDYFNRPFVAASLQTRGLTGKFPLTLNGTANATVHVRDAKNRNKDIVLAPNGTFPNAAALAIAFQNAANAVADVPSNWINCTASGSEVVCQLANLETAEGSFIRVKSGVQLATLGLDGPMEAPGAGSVPASLTGKNVPGGFPLTIPAGTRVDIEVRGKGDPNDEDAKVRQFQIPLAAGSVADPGALANLLLPTLNSEFNWVESWGAGPNRLGLRLLSSESNNYAAIRVIGGVNLQNLGLDGPIRVDGVISQPGTITVRGDISDIIGEALSLYLAKRAAATNTPIDLAHEDDLDALFSNEMGNFESYLVLFTEATTGIDGRRAGARATNSFNIRVPGANGYVFTRQKQAGGMAGSGLQPWHVWAHELGHVLGFLDHYWKATYMQTFDQTHDYLNAWSMMDADVAASHVDAWHKRKVRWIPPKQIADVPAPVNGLPQTHAFEMIPLEFQPSDYPGFGTPAQPVRQLLRIKLSEHHWIYVENRQPAAVASKNLPDDALGLSPPDASGQAGGILVTDTADPFSEVLYRPAVTSLNPHGTGVPVGSAIVQSRAMHPGDSLDLNTTYPAYDGIRIRVTRAIPSPMYGTPEMLAVEVDRWPGKFMDLEIRPWHAPTEYATPDIWFDWDDDELYPGVDPPLGTGDEVHWHPKGEVVMTIRVRVHNRGNLDATGVVVRTSINEPMGMGDKGTFVALPDSAPQDIPGGQSRDFAFEWKPTASAHTCVRAEIFTHSTAYGELDLNNNSAQENVTTFWPTPGSPYQPIDFAFKVNNDFPHPIVVDLLPSGLAPGMKLELERKYVVLAADEDITLHGRLWLDENVIRPGPRERRCDYRFNLHAMQRTEDSVLPFGGISIGVAPGVKSQLVHQEIVRDAGGTAIYGRLEGDYHSNQQVDAALVGFDGKTYEGTTKTANNGSFKIVVPKVPSGPGNLMLFYFGPDMARSYLGPINVTLP